MKGSLSARGGRSHPYTPPPPPPPTPTPSAVWALECSCKDQLFASLAVVLFTTDDIIAIGKQAVPIVCALCCVISLYPFATEEGPVGAETFC